MLSYDDNLCFAQVENAFRQGFTRGCLRTFAHSHLSSLCWMRRQQQQRDRERVWRHVGLAEAITVFVFQSAFLANGSLSLLHCSHPPLSWQLPALSSLWLRLPDELTFIFVMLSTVHPC